MKIHEYQARPFSAKYGVPVPRGEVAFSAQEAGEVARRLGGGVVVVKAQIHAGGRGKAGGVKVVKSADEAEKVAAGLLGATLVTYQTGPSGQRVGRLLIEEGLAIDRELYLEHGRRPRVTEDRDDGQRRRRRRHRRGRRQDAGEDPQGVHRPRGRAAAVSGAQAGVRAGPRRTQVGKATKMMLALYKAFIATDASLLEINPLIVTKSGDLLALDAKMNFDDNALYRHRTSRICATSPRRIRSRSRRRSTRSTTFVWTATSAAWSTAPGLAMATMDIIKLAGGMPANFLDVGGGANAEQIRNAFKILMSDKNVKAVLINIFGGILRCDVLAQGVIAAVKELGVPVPIVIRMKGTNVEEGKRMLAESGLNFATADTMSEAADKVVALAGGPVDGGAPRQEHAPAGAGADRPRRHVSREGGRGVSHARSSAASRPARAARRTKAGRSSTPSPMRSRRPAPTRR